jgi:hypothetical protein
MRRTTLLTVSLAVILPGTLPAQGPDPSAARAAIDTLSPMVGRWRGEAWMAREGGQRVETVMTETVERKLGGTVLLIEGVGQIPAAGGGEPRVVHHALAILSFDPRTGGYQMRSHLANGLSGDFVVTLVDGGVRWSREVPGGTVRNTARFTADEWHEIGEFSRDGATWTQVMEIRLRREAAP